MQPPPMIKTLLAASLLTVSTLSLALGDVGETAGRSTDTFSGTITAVETDRDSITVESSEGTVKMFAVDASRKEKLSTGQSVTIRYVDAYSWPLQVVSLSTGGPALDK